MGLFGPWFSSAATGAAAPVNVQTGDEAERGMAGASRHQQSTTSPKAASARAAAAPSSGAKPSAGPPASSASDPSKPHVRPQSLPGILNAASYVAGRVGGRIHFFSVDGTYGTQWPPGRGGVGSSADGDVKEPNGNRGTRSGGPDSPGMGFGGTSPAGSTAAGGGNGSTASGNMAAGSGNGSTAPAPTAPAPTAPANRSGAAIPPDLLAVIPTAVPAANPAATMATTPAHLRGCSLLVPPAAIHSIEMANRQPLPMKLLRWDAKNLVFVISNVADVFHKITKEAGDALTAAATVVTNHEPKVVTTRDGGIKLPVGTVLVSVDDGGGGETEYIIVEKNKPAARPDDPSKEKPTTCFTGLMRWLHTGKTSEMEKPAANWVTTTSYERLKAVGGDDRFTMSAGRLYELEQLFSVKKHDATVAAWQFRYVGQRRGLAGFVRGNLPAGGSSPDWLAARKPVPVGLSPFVFQSRLCTVAHIISPGALNLN